MTEHLKRQLQDAASDARRAKEKVRSANEFILSNQATIGTSKQIIASQELQIENAEAAIESAVEARFRANADFELASQRLSFFNRELIDHPHLGI